MGVRAHNPTTGRFLQTDPIIGGSANAYDYVNGDPSTTLTSTEPATAVIRDGGGAWVRNGRCRASHVITRVNNKLRGYGWNTHTSPIRAPAGRHLMPGVDGAGS